jgi:hypothetical protein
MITRYTVIFAAQMIEPDAEGRWVKYEEHTQALKHAEQHGAFEIKDRDEQIAQLKSANQELEAELAEVRSDRDGLRARQSPLLKAARDRLELHGHAPNCDSRYGTVSAQGNAHVGSCNCGLEDWMKESGVIHG